MALSAPSKAVYQLYPGQCRRRNPFPPSSLVGTVEQILPCCRKGKELEEDGGDIESESDAFFPAGGAVAHPHPLVLHPPAAVS